ncbi:diaminopimelate epimerase [Methanocrinis sp.]|uniref:diaminopimelate epimerase n=1 Tax=Methanocrinis sp. TaxID=3101522 RepID=UPI003D11C2AE
MKLKEMTDIRLDESPYDAGGISFTKLQGNGNDFILIDEHRRVKVADSLKGSFAIQCCHRNFGIGGDGVLFLSPSDHADLRMRLFQPDGSEAEMCGNGVRCLAKYAWDAGMVGQCFEVETLAGIITLKVREIGGDFWARVEMGTPCFDRAGIPALGEGEFLMEPLEGFEVSAVNTGVPHAVIFVDDLMDLPIEDVAPHIRRSSIFPEGANVNFVRIGETFAVRTFERGVEGETLSCGTGSVASAAVARRMGMAGDEIFVETRGGPLLITFEGDRAYMDGPASTVYSGELSDEFHWDISQGL